MTKGKSTVNRTVSHSPLDGTLLLCPTLGQAYQYRPILFRETQWLNIRNHKIVKILQFHEITKAFGQAYQQKPETTTWNYNIFRVSFAKPSIHWIHTSNGGSAIFTTVSFWNWSLFSTKENSHIKLCMDNSMVVSCLQNKGVGYQLFIY